MLTVWRIVKTKFAAHSFDGEGASRYGGRWNSPGTRMVYTSQSIALAVLEILVNLKETSLLSSYSLCAAHFDASLVSSLDRSKLPANWRASPFPPEVQLIGDSWIASQSSVALEVPSAIIERESNYLINPSHPHFASVAIDEPIPFNFDPRLINK
jgi:RES domain-containing protein